MKTGGKNWIPPPSLFAIDTVASPPRRRRPPKNISLPATRVLVRSRWSQGSSRARPSSRKQSVSNRFVRGLGNIVLKIISYFCFDVAVICYLFILFVSESWWFWSFEFFADERIDRVRDPRTIIVGFYSPAL